MLAVGFLQLPFEAQGMFRVADQVEADGGSGGDDLTLLFGVSGRERKTDRVVPAQGSVRTGIDRVVWGDWRMRDGGSGHEGRSKGSQANCDDFRAFHFHKLHSWRLSGNRSCRELRSLSANSGPSTIDKNEFAHKKGLETINTDIVS